MNFLLLLKDFDLFYFFSSNYNQYLIELFCLGFFLLFFIICTFFFLVEDMNLIILFMLVELIFLAFSLIYLSLSLLFCTVHGFLLVIVVLTFAAVDAVIGLALVLVYHKVHKSINLFDFIALIG